MAKKKLVRTVVKTVGLGATAVTKLPLLLGLALGSAQKEGRKLRQHRRHIAINFSQHGLMGR